MNKRITVTQVRSAATSAREAGLNVGAFFIVCYPGETYETVLDTFDLPPRFPRLPLLHDAVPTTEYAAARTNKRPNQQIVEAARKRFFRARLHL